MPAKPLTHTEGADTYLIQPRRAGEVHVTDTATGKIEVWHNHRFNGSGCNNWVIESGGRKFDLEFCRSL